MSTKRFYNLDDLARHDASFTVKCLACGRERAFSALQLSAYCEARDRYVLRVREHRSASLHAIASRMRCSRCRSKRIDWWPRNRD